MTTEFSTLDKAKAGEKISFVGYVSEIGDLKSGTGAQGDYTYKRLVIQDATASHKLTVWNEDIKKFVLGGKYEIVNAFAKDYKGSISLGIQYATVKLVSTDTEQTTMPEVNPKQPSTPEPAVEKPTKPVELPKISEQFSEFIESETIIILQIEEEVLKTLKHYKPLPAGQSYDGGYIGMKVKELYRESKKTKFEKAYDD